MSNDLKVKAGIEAENIKLKSLSYASGDIVTIDETGKLSRRTKEQTIADIGSISEEKVNTMFLRDLDPLGTGMLAVSENGEIISLSEIDFGTFQNDSGFTGALIYFDEDDNPVLEDYSPDQRFYIHEGNALFLGTNGNPYYLGVRNAIEAPYDSNLYVRKNGSWKNLVAELDVLDCGPL